MDSARLCNLAGRYDNARLHRLAESIPRLLKRLKIRSQKLFKKFTRMDKFQELSKCNLTTGLNVFLGPTLRNIEPER
jgi:hypothetical protein